MWNALIASSDFVIMIMAVDRIEVLFNIDQIRRGQTQYQLMNGFDKWRVHLNVSFAIGLSIIMNIPLSFQFHIYSSPCPDYDMPNGIWSKTPVSGFSIYTNFS